MSIFKIFRGQARRSANEWKGDLATMRVSTQYQRDMLRLGKIEHRGLMRQEDGRPIPIQPMEGAIPIALGPGPIVNACEL